MLNVLNPRYISVFDPIGKELLRESVLFLFFSRFIKSFIFEFLFLNQCGRNNLYYMNRNRISLINFSSVVHTTLKDLLPRGTYFRFNPRLNDNFVLDEFRAEKLDDLRQQTLKYMDGQQV